MKAATCPVMASSCLPPRSSRRVTWSSGSAVPLRFRALPCMPRDYPKAATAIGGYEDGKRAPTPGGLAGELGRQAGGGPVCCALGKVTAQPEATFDSPGGPARPIAEIGVPSSTVVVTEAVYEDDVRSRERMPTASSSLLRAVVRFSTRTGNPRGPAQCGEGRAQTIGRSLFSRGQRGAAGADPGQSGRPVKALMAGSIVEATSRGGTRHLGSSGRRGRGGAAADRRRRQELTAARPRICNQEVAGSSPAGSIGRKAATRG